VTPRLVNEKYELKYRIFSLKYLASSSSWLVNNRFSSAGTSGVTIDTFPFLQQNAGPSYGNRNAPQY
jgi:hypothetical protein